MKITKQHITTIFLHISLWSLFMIIPLLVFPNPAELKADLGIESPARKPLLFFSYLSFLMTIFYGNYYVMIPKVWRRYGSLVYLISMAALLFLLIYLQHLVRLRVFLDLEPFGVYTKFFRSIGFLGITAIGTTLWAVSSGFWILQEWKKSEERLKESEQKRIETELDQLKKQINPHFLFNTLNSIYALTLTNNEQASDAVLRLSKLMSYILTDASSDYVNLQKDIDHVQHFIELNHFRLSDKSPLTYHIHGQFDQFEIAPLLMLPFVENAFKYGTSNVEETPISIKIQLEENYLHFYCENRIIQRQQIQVQSSGLGIPNVKRRLDLIYPNKYDLKISDEDEIFTVSLQILLEDEHSNPAPKKYFSKQETSMP